LDKFLVCRGQLLCGKAENEEERVAIEGQLRVVNGRWEELRELSMHRQNALQLSLNRLQTKQLATIDKWLTEMECEMMSCEPLADSQDAALRQIEAHTQLQAKIHAFQDTINDLSSFVAVLVQSGKADVRQFLAAAGPQAGPSAIEENVKADRVVKPTESSLKSTTMEELAADPGETTTDTEPEEATHQVRKMISICQEKLIEIKDQEAKVNRLQLELEHMHLSADLTPAHLKRANDAFEKFAKGWARIVTKISEAMNVLTGHDEADEEQVVAKGIEQWIEGCDKVLTELMRTTKEERAKRLSKLEQQLETQQGNLTFIEKDPLKKAILKKGLDIVKKRIDGMSEEPSTSKSEGDLNAELEGEWCTVGDVAALDKEVERADKAVEVARSGNMSSETVEKAETRRAEMIERRRATLAAFEKMKAAEEGMQSIAASVEATSSSDISLSGAITELKHARERLASYENLKKEAERAAEKMLALDDNVPQTITTTTRNRLRELSERWRELEDAIEDHLNCARKEQKRSVQNCPGDSQKNMRNLLVLIPGLEPALCVAASKNSDASTWVLTRDLRDL
ncbi:hypothetical protein ANCDUO_11561, partial [Ancylostoma duodenale]